MNSRNVVEAVVDWAMENVVGIEKVWLLDIRYLWNQCLESVGINPDNPTEFITRLPEKGVCNVTFVMKNDDEISALYNSSHDLGTTEALFGIIYYALGKCQCVRVCENMRRLICAD